MLGRILPRAKDHAKIEIATKANPWDGVCIYASFRTLMFFISAGTNGCGGLSRLRVREQLEASLSAMGLEQVEIFYLHAPDSGTPLEETLAEVNTYLFFIRQLSRASF